MTKVAKSKGAKMLGEWMERTATSADALGAMIGVNGVTVVGWRERGGVPKLASAFKLEEKCGIPPRAWLKKIGK